MLPSIGSRITLEGQKEYKDAIKQIKVEQQLLGSEMRKLSKEFEGNSNSIEALDKKSGLLNKQYTEQVTRIKTLNGALYDAKNVYGENSNEVKTWQAQLNDAETKLSSLDKELKVNEKYLNEAKKSTDGTAMSIDEFGKKTKFGRGLVDEYGNEIKNTDKAVSEFGDELKNTEGKVSIFGDVLKANLASELIISSVRMLGDGIKQLSSHAIGVGSDFTSAMSSVGATMGFTVEQIQAGDKAFLSLSDAAKQMGEKTEFSATQAANTLENLALAGYDAEKSISTLPKVLDLAGAGGLDLAASSTLVTDSMSALGLETEQLDEHIDKMAKTAQSSNTNIGQLGAGMLASAGMARSTGQNLDVLNTSLGILADNGEKGAEGGTKLRNILQSLASPTTKAKDELDRLGITVADNRGNFRQLDEIMTDLNAELKNMTAEERTNVISKVFNKTDITAVNSLLNSTGGEFEELKGKIENADGAAGEMAKTMKDNLQGDMKGLESVAEAVGITLFEKFEKPLRSATQSGTQGLSELNKELKSGELGSGIDKLALNFADLADGAISFGLEALPKVVDGLSWIVGNADNIISVVGGIAVGAAAFKTGSAIQKGMTEINEKWEEYQAATKGAGDAQGFLNAMMAANPVVLVATGLAVVTAAMIKLSLNTEKTSKNTSEFGLTLDKSIEKASGLNAVLKNGNDQWEQNERSMESNAVVAKKLSDELYDLAEKESLSNTEKYKMQTLVENLNDMIPELSLSFNEQTGELNKQKNEVDRLVSSYLEMAKAEAAVESLKVMLKEQLEAEVALQELQENAPKNLKETTQAYSSLFDMIKTGRDRKKEVKELEEQTELLGKRIETTLDIVTSSSKKAEESGKQLSDAVSKSLGKIINANEETTKAQEVALAKYREAIDETSQDIYKSMGLFDEFAKGTEISGKELLANLKGQVDGMHDWAKNLQELANKGIEDGLLHELSEMGPKAYAEIKALNKMTRDQLDDYSELWVQKGRAVNEAATVQLKVQKRDMNNETQGIISDMGRNANRAGEEYAKNLKNKNRDIQSSLDYIRKSSEKTSSDMLVKSGEDTANGFARGFESKKPSILKSVEDVVSSVKTRTNQILEIKSPSKVFEEIGMFTGEGFEIGFLKSMKNAVGEFKIPTFTGGKELASNNYGGDTFMTENGGDTYIMNVNMNEVDEVQKMINVFKGFKSTMRAGRV